ncbi:hypothetical protein GCM10027072_06510 [Streptomyces bullii]
MFGDACCAASAVRPTTPRERFPACTDIARRHPTRRHPPGPPCPDSFDRDEEDERRSRPAGPPRPRHPDLAATVADFARRTGVVPAEGGVHVGFGTHNHLVALGGTSYLEIIGPDPEQPAPTGPRPFGVDGLTAPRTVTWAISRPGLDAAVATARARGYDPGAVRPMSRRRPDGTLLEWRLTDGGTAHPSGLVPFLIDWGPPPTRPPPVSPTLPWCRCPPPPRTRGRSAPC